MMKITRYIIGFILIVGILWIILFFYPGTVSSGWEKVFKKGLGILILSSFFCLYRILRGPSSSDRIVAIDMLGILIIGICCLLTLLTKRSWYIDIGIAWALQSFISTLALAKFLEGKDFDE